MNVLPEKTIVKMETINKILTYNIPSIQRLLNEEYIDSLVKDQIEEFEREGSFSIAQSLTCGLYENKMFVLDGQHRLEMFSRLKKLGYEFKQCLPVVVYNLKTMDEFNFYYGRINKHNPIHPLELDDNWTNIKDFFEWFCERYKGYFKTTTQCKCPHFNKDVMMKYFKDFNITKKISNVHLFIKTVQELNDHILDNFENIKNNQIGNDLSSNFDKCLKKSENNKCMLGIWRNFEWVHICLDCIDNNDNPGSINLSKFCKVRSHIPQDLKLDVWNKRNQGKNPGECYSCEDELAYGNMECGHIVPHCKGGGIELNNLEPICRNCNRQMGIMNLMEYKKNLSRDTDK